MRFIAEWGGVNPLKRVKNLYIHLWIIYAIFVPLGSFVLPEWYPGSLRGFIENATSWHCTYIGEQWFFLPYILLMLLSKWIFQLFDHWKGIWVLTVSFAVYAMTVLVTKRYGEDALGENMLFYNVFLTLHMLLAFSLGFLAKRDNWMERVSDLFEKWHLKNNWVVLGALLLLCGIRCFISHQTVDPVYAIVFVVLFSMVSVGSVPAKVLTFLGKHSMNIWLIHTWICIRLFHEFVFGLHYPIVIYLFVLFVSLAVSIFVEFVYGYLDKWLGLSKKRV